jgi:DNA-binding ferritin-like protein
VPASLVDDPEYWLKRAEEARTLADQMKDAHTRSLMLGIAESYDKIAKWATGRTGEQR